MTQAQNSFQLTKCKTEITAQMQDGTAQYAFKTYDTYAFMAN